MKQRDVASLSKGRNWPCVVRPQLAVHFDQKLPIDGKTHPNELNFETFISRIIFDRNSQVRFHKLMVAIGIKKLPVHGVVQSWLYNHS
jgi:hypothetical protein